MAQTPAFLETTFNPEGKSFPTRIQLVPAGEYEAELIRIVDASYNDKNTNERVAAIRVRWLICDPALQEEMGIKDPQAEQFITIELDEHGNLLMKKNAKGELVSNSRLGRGLLDPLGFNTGKKWSFPQLLHSRAWVRVELPNEAELAMFSNVVAVGAKREAVAKRAR